MKLLSFKVMVALILVTLLKPVAPMFSDVSASTSTEGDYCLMMMKKDAVQSCHSPSSDAELPGVCCDSGCSSSYEPLLFQLAILLPSLNSVKFKPIFITLYSTYSKPATPPPILA